MKKEEKMIDVSKIFISPVLSGPTNVPMWTGIISSDRINEFLISNQIERESFFRLVQEYENTIKEYRDIFNASKVMMTSNSINSKFAEKAKAEELLRRINELSKKLRSEIKQIKIDMELFWVMLCQDYEDILKDNKNEFQGIAPDVQKQFRVFHKSITERSPIIRERFVEKDGEYVITSFVTEAQKERILRKDENAKKLTLFVKTMAQKQNLTVSEVMENVFESIYLSDFFTIFNYPNYAQMQYECVLKNYLLYKKFTFEEIEEMSQEEIAEAVSETYDKFGMKYHKKFIAKSIQDGVYYLDFDKLMLLTAIRHLDSFENIRDSLDSKPEKPSDSVEKESESMDTTPDVKISEQTYTLHEVVRDTRISEVIERMRSTEELIKTILELKLISSRTKINVILHNQYYEEISRKKLEEMMEKFCDGIYLTELIENEFIQIAFFNGMSSWSDEFIKRINFKERDIVILSLVDLNNFKRLYENGKIDKDHIMSLLAVIENGALEQMLLEIKDTPGREEQVKQMLENSSQFLSFLVHEKIISFSELKLFYDKRVVRLDDLEKLEVDKTEQEKLEFRNQLGNQIDSLSFLNAYKDYIEHKLRYEKAIRENDPDASIYKDTMEIKRREKDSELMLFSKYKLDGLSDEEKSSFIDELLLTYCVELEHENEQVIPETLRQMYKDGIISFENISDLDQSYLQTVIIDIMFVRGELSLDDTRKLRETLSLEALIGILNKAMANSSITQTQKISLIMNIFHNGIEDEERADKFLSQLHAEHYVGVKYTDLIIENQPKKKQDLPGIDTDGIKDLSKEWVYPKYVKWEFLNALDKDAIITVYANGYVEAYSKKLGVRIIEKYFDVDKEGNQFGRDAYGHATFIVTESAYRDNFEFLVDNFSDGEPLLNPKSLSAIVPREDRIRHNTHSQSKNWMRSMAKYFDIDLDGDLDLIKDTRYTREELEFIRNIIITYENAYVER